MSTSGSKGRKDTVKSAIIIVVILALVILIAVLRPALDQRLHYVSNPRTFEPLENYNTSMEMKDPLIGFVRNVTANHYLDRPVEYPFELDIEGDWEIAVVHYLHGEIKGEAVGKGANLTRALEDAVRGCMNNELSYYELNFSRFNIQFREPMRYSFIEFRGEAVELTGDTVPIYELDKQMIGEAIQDAKKYLVRVIDPEVTGAHKYYYALDDTFENRIHCIYTASLMFSLMRIYDFDRDESLWPHIMNCSEFLLSMQNKDKDSRAYGGFYYSYYFENDEKEEKFVVGTTSKTIFTLLMLYERTGEKKFLEAAELAADWLLTMQKDDGTVKSYTRQVSGKWYSSTQFSFLFNGQVLSALSRLYLVDGKQKYYDGAEKIAKVFAAEVEEQGYYLGDDYRSPNPVSSSWAILALFDFAKASGDDYYMNMVMNNSASLLRRQFTDDSNVLSYGRWDASQTTSGNGWLDEVFMEIYHYRKQNDMGGLDTYLTALTRVTRYIMQNTYTEQNCYMVKNPAMAVGGAYWNSDNRYVRTDSVCHAVNAFAGIYHELDDNKILVTVPREQEPFYDALEQMRTG